MSRFNLALLGSWFHIIDMLFYCSYVLARLDSFVAWLRVHPKFHDSDRGKKIFNDFTVEFKVGIDATVAGSRSCTIGFCVEVSFGIGSRE